MPVPKVVLTSDVAASPDLLWRAIKDFSAIASWHPLVRTVTSQGNAVGSTRRVELQGAGRFVERLEQINEAERLYRYAIVDSPLPVTNCTVEVRVTDKGDGTSTVAWQSSFESEARGELQAVKTFQRLTQSALDTLQRQFDPKP